MRANDTMHPSHRPVWRTLLLGAVLAAAAALTSSTPAQEGGREPRGDGGVRANLERLGSFYYAGDPVMVRLSVFNTGETALENGSGMDLLGSTEVIDLGKQQPLEPRPDRKADARGEPRVLLPGGFFGFITDLGETVSGLDVPGRYRARLKVAGAEPAEVDLVIIERYDPSKAYRAVLDTDYGTLSFDLLGNAAPRHVQNFYDLANQGYYDGSLFHVIVKGIEIHGGDKTGDGRSHPGYWLEPEIGSDLKHKRGTLSMVRTGPRDHGAHFVISLGENERLDGVLSIFGTLAEGDGTLTALEALPTSGTRDAVPYRPLRPVTIRTIRVEAAPEESAATAAGTEATGS